MASYVVLANFTDQGIRAIKDSPKRAKGFRDVAKKMNVTIKDIFWTFGRFDVVLTMEAAKDEDVAALLLKVGSLGNLKSETLRAYTESEVGALVDRI